MRPTVVSWPGEQEQEDHRDQLGAGQRVLLVAGGDQRAQQVVAGVRARALDEAGDEAVQAGERRRARRCRGSSSEETTSAVHRRKSARSPPGTPSISPMTVTGSGAAKSAMRSAEPRAHDVVGERAGDLLDAAAQGLDPARGEGRRDETAQPGMVGRVRGQQVGAQAGAVLQRASAPRLLPVRRAPGAGPCSAGGRPAAARASSWRVTSQPYRPSRAVTRHTGFGSRSLA